MDCKWQIETQVVRVTWGIFDTVKEFPVWLFPYFSLVANKLQLIGIKIPENAYSLILDLVYFKITSNDF